MLGLNYLDWNLGQFFHFVLDHAPFEESNQTKQGYSQEKPEEEEEEEEKEDRSIRPQAVRNALASWRTIVSRKEKVMKDSQGEEMDENERKRLEKAKRDSMNVRDNEGKTPMMLAAYSEWDHGTIYSSEILDILEISEGVKPDLSLVDRRGWTVFDHQPSVLIDQTDFSDEVKFSFFLSFSFFCVNSCAC